MDQEWGKRSPEFETADEHRRAEAEAIIGMKNERNTIHNQIDRTLGLRHISICPAVWCSERAGSASGDY